MSSDSKYSTNEEKSISRNEAQSSDSNSGLPESRMDDRTGNLSPVGSNKSQTSIDTLSSHSGSAVNNRDHEVISLSEDVGEQARRESKTLSRNTSRNSTARRRLSLRGSFSARSSFEGSLSGSNLSRLATRYSVKDVYGDMEEEDIRARRTQTRNTILSTLSHKVQTEGEDEEYRLDGGDVVSEKSEALSQTEDIYENIPDIPVPTKDYGGEFASLDPELVSWEGEDDPDYPLNWSFKKKCLQTGIVAFYTLVSPMSSSVCSPAMTSIAEEFGIETQVMKSFAVSVMVLAWALGPLLIAPLSESDKIGRAPVLNVSIWILFIFNLACGFSKTTAQLCVFRFLGGLGGCAALNVGAGTISDLWNSRQRQVAMAFYSICPTLGPVLSPIMSSFIVQNVSWRWTFWVLSIFNGSVALFGLIFFRETYSPRLLSIKAKRLRAESGNPHLHTIFEIADGESSRDKLVRTVSRPLKLLFTHPMIIGLGSFMAFTYGFMYLMITTFPGVWGGTYGFSTGISGLMFISLGTGFTLGTIFWTIAIDKIYNAKIKKNNGVAKPEFRLPCLCFSGVGIPVGLIWYGWSAQKELHWIMPALGAGIFAFSLVAVFQTIQIYLIDMNTRFAASSVAAAAVFRSLFGFSFPLFGNKMYDKLNYGWGNTLCAFIGLALGVPFPIFCLKYGESLRNWANRRMAREQAKRDQKNLARLERLNQK